MMWAGIATNRRTHLVTISGSFNAESYRNEIPTPHVLPFIAANARLHVVRANMDFLHQNNVDLLPWPALSPDLSPIEHFWDQLDRQVRRRAQQLETLDQLRIALEDEWQRIHMASINRLIVSMHRRCPAVIDNRGSFTRY